MSSRNDAFRTDPESSVLKSLGYSEEEISGTPGEATPDDLRTSLRQLSAAHSSDVQRAHLPSTPPNPKFEKQRRTPQGDDYWEGRKDEAELRKSNMNPGSGFKPPRPRAQASADRQRKQTLKQISRIMKTFSGARGNPGKALGGVSRAQRGRR